MNRKMSTLIALIVGVTVVACCESASAQGNIRTLHGFDKYPGHFFYHRERPAAHRIEMTVVADGASQGYSLKLDFPNVKGTGIIHRELGRQGTTNYNGYEGFSVWVKGDGSDAKGAVVFGYSSGPTATFPLKNKNWHRVDLRWVDFTPQSNPRKIGVLAFTLAQGSKRPASYVIDRPCFVRSFDRLIEDDKKARIGELGFKTKMPERKAFKEYTAQTNQLAKTKAKLKSKKPVTIVAWGDSITAGAQLWPVGSADAQKRAIYDSQLAERLRAHFGYKNVKMVNSSQGGRQTHQAWPRIQKEVLDHKPDVVIVALGVNDSNYSNLNRFKENLGNIVRKLRDEKIEVILWSTIPTKFRVSRSEPFAKHVRELSKREKIPMADVRACLMARGEVAIAEHTADGVHCNPRGHELLAEVLFAMFSD